MTPSHIDQGPIDQGPIDQGPIDQGPMREGSSERARALVVNAGAMVAGRMGVAVLGWSGTLLIVRTLSVEEFGRFSFVFSFMGLISVLSELGIGRASIKGLLDDQHDRARFAGTMVVLRGLLGLLSYGLALGFTVVAGYPGEVVRAMALAGLVMVLATPSHAVETVFHAHLRLRWVAAGNVAGQLTQLGLITAIVVAGGSVVLFTIPAVVAEVVILAWRLAKVGKLQPLRLNVDLKAWKAILREAAPLAAGAILASFYFRVDSVMLSKLDTFAAVGTYGVAYKFVDLVQYVPEALMLPVLSLMVAAWPDDRHAFADTLRRAFVMLVVFGVMIAVEFAVFARPLISLLYGEQYAAGAGAARLVVAAACLSAMGTLAVTTLVAMGRHRVYPLVALAGLAVNVGLNFWAIPAWSYEGAAWATVVSEIIVVGLLVRFVAGLDAVPKLPYRSAAVVLGTGAVAGLAALATWTVMPWPAAALLAGTLYLALLHASRVTGPDGLRDLLR